MVYIQRETWADAGKEATALTADYWQEVRGKQEADLLDLMDIYPTYEEQGRLALITARADNVMIGFTLFLASPHHHSQILTGFAEGWYILPDYRKGWTGIKLFRAVEEALRGMGCEHMYAGTSKQKDVSVILRRLRFEPVEVMYCKSLKMGDS